MAVRTLTVHNGIVTARSDKPASAAPRNGSGRVPRGPLFRWAEYTRSEGQFDCPATALNKAEIEPPTRSGHCDRRRKKFETLGPLVRAFSRNRVGSVPSAPPPRVDLMRASANSPPSPRPALISGIRHYRRNGRAIARPLRSADTPGIRRPRRTGHSRRSRRDTHGTFDAMMRDLQYHRLIRSMQ